MEINSFDKEKGNDSRSVIPFLFQMLLLSHPICSLRLFRKRSTASSKDSVFSLLGSVPVIGHKSELISADL